MKILLKYTKYLRMSKETFSMLLEKVTPYISKKNTTMRASIPAAERLAATLRFLATGETYTSLQYQFRIHRTTLSIIIPETCEAIYTALKDEYLQVPNTEEKWTKIAEDFEERWNFNHCLGALDGKHIVIKPPPSSGSMYYNYKHTFRIVLMALVDADYKFTYVDVGCNGRISDGGVFKNCSLSTAIEEEELNIPKAKPLPGRDIPIPYVIVADDAFPLKTYIMKPHNSKDQDVEKRMFDYRLSRARRIVENAFGILANRFRVFMSPIALEPEKVQMVVLAAVCLHNMLRSEQKSNYMPPGSVDFEDVENNDVRPGEWRADSNQGSFQPIIQQGSNMYSADAKGVREEFTQYFNTNGSVDWQWGML